MFTKHVLEQFVMPPKKRQADIYTADVKRGFSAQNEICISERGNIPRFKCLKVLHLFDLYFSTVYGLHFLLEVPFSPKEHFFFPIS